MWVDAKKAHRHKGIMDLKARSIIDHCGRKEVAEKLGVALRRVDRARTEDRLPASWYAGMCMLAGEPLPWTLFTFKGL